MFSKRIDRIFLALCAACASAGLSTKALPCSLTACRPPSSRLFTFRKPVQHVAYSKAKAMRNATQESAPHATPTLFHCDTGGPYDTHIILITPRRQSKIYPPLPFNKRETTSVKGPAYPRSCNPEGPCWYQAHVLQEGRRLPRRPRAQEVDCMLLYHGILCHVLLYTLYYVYYTVYDIIWYRYMHTSIITDTNVYIRDAMPHYSTLYRTRLD